MTAAWPRYLATTLREKAELAALVGNHSDAIFGYETYLALCEHSEQQVMSQVAAVRAALLALRTPQRR
jgi:hypothetical protein